MGTQPLVGPLARLLAGQEEERRRICDGLHDHTIQLLTAAALRLQALAPGVVPSEQSLLGDAQNAVRSAIVQLRDLIAELHPPALESHGLVAALDDFGTELCGGAGVGFRITGSADASPPVDAIAYRAGRALLLDACRQTGVTSIEVAVSSDAGGVRVVVHDDRSAPEPGASAPRPGALGELRSLADVTGGLLESRHTVAGGTTVDLWFPGVRAESEADPAG